jgi:hypothetical protein
MIAQPIRRHRPQNHRNHDANIVATNLSPKIMWLHESSLLHTEPTPKHSVSGDSNILVVIHPVVACTRIVHCTLLMLGFEMTVTRPHGLPAWVQIPVLPSDTCRSLYELLGGVSLGFLPVVLFRMVCHFLHLLGAQAEAHPRYGVIPIHVHFVSFFIQNSTTVVQGACLNLPQPAQGLRLL